MKRLGNVTLICADTYNPGAAIASMKKSMSKVSFVKCILLTDIKIDIAGIEVIKIDPLNSKEEYSRFIIKELYKYFNTEFCLIVQHDSWVLDEKAWNDDFYNYDVIGAAWTYQDGRNNSNGGFSLRSHRLQEILGTDRDIQMCSPEDEIIGRLYRNYLIEIHNIKFPTDDVCDKFSFELREPTQSTFGFHGYFYPPFQKTIVIRRNASLGDVLAVEPVLEYFYNKGYRVVLDTLPQFYQLFSQHYFPILPKPNLDRRIPYKEYNLDMSYESKPKQLHLKTYFEFCEVKDYVLRNQKLSLHFNPKIENKLFKKYACIHIDKRQPHRNIYGIDWKQVVEFLNKNGYTVLQLGRGEHEIIEGAIEMNTPTESFLMWVIGGSDLFVGIDSGIANIAVGFNVPSVIFSGSVDLRFIYADLSNILWLHNHDKKPCDKAFCWHEEVGCIGSDCYVNLDRPPCSHFDTDNTIFEINKFINK